MEPATQVKVCYIETETPRLATIRLTGKAGWTADDAKKPSPRSEIGDPHPIEAVADADLGLGAVLKVTAKRAKLPSPPYTVAGSPAWGYAGLYCPGTPRAPLRWPAWFAVREQGSTCHGVCPRRSNAGRLINHRVRGAVDKRAAVHS